MDPKNSEEIKKITEDLLGKLDIHAKISMTEDDQQVVHINLQTEETGLLIGYHGETLYSLQLIIGLITFRHLKEWIRIVLEVGDYRQRKEEQLILMAKNIAIKVKQTKEPVSIPYLTSNERRIVHLALQDDPELTSESEGEGDSRHLVIKVQTNTETAPLSNKEEQTP